MLIYMVAVVSCVKLCSVAILCYQLSLLCIQSQKLGLGSSQIKYPDKC